MSKTRIEWCDHVINPVVGCSHCSPGCDNCYAERYAARLAKHPNPKVRKKYAGVVDENGKWTGKLSYMSEDCISLLPKGRGRLGSPTRKFVFVGSMTDLFHESICESYLVNFWTQMCFHPLHTFLILTKRPKRMKSFLDGYYEDPQMPAPFIWLGVTVCNQTEADAKIPILLQTPAAKRFVSVEPMLGPVDLHPYLPGGCDCEACTYGRGCGHKPDWVIAGGETGPGARPMHPDWVRSLRDQCVGAGVPFFFKGWGEWGPNAINMITGEPAFRRFTSFEHFCVKAPTWMYKGDKLICPDGHVPVNGGREGKSYPMHIVRRVGKRCAGRMLDGKEWNEVPQ